MLCWDVPRHRHCSCSSCSMKGKSDSSETALEIFLVYSVLEFHFFLRFPSSFLPPFSSLLGTMQAKIYNPL